MYGKLATSCFKYQVCLYGSELSLNHVCKIGLRLNLVRVRDTVETELDHLLAVGGNGELEAVPFLLHCKNKKVTVRFSRPQPGCH
jgi:hypothetical protein